MSISLADDGMTTLEIIGHPPVTADLYEVHDCLAALLRAHGGDAAAYYGAARDYLCKLGLPSLSGRAITRLAEAVFQRVADQKKSDRPIPPSEPPA